MMWNYIRLLDYLWHITLPVLASTISAFATLTLLTKNSFLDEIKKQYVITAKAKGLSEKRRGDCDRHHLRFHRPPH